MTDDLTRRLGEQILRGVKMLHEEQNPARSDLVTLLGGLFLFVVLWRVVVVVPITYLTLSGSGLARGGITEKIIGSPGSKDARPSIGTGYGLRMRA